jgi:hypothetical protein
VIGLQSYRVEFTDGTVLRVYATDPERAAELADAIYKDEGGDPNAYVIEVEEGERDASDE